MKRMLLFVLLMLSVGWVFAATATIGDAGTTQSNAPFNFENVYGWSKNIYTSSELSAKGINSDINIQSIGIKIPAKIGGRVNLVKGNQKIYMRVVNYSNYTDDKSFPTNGLTLVYEGEIEFDRNATQFIINLDEEFLYQYGSNNHLELIWLDMYEGETFKVKDITSTSMEDNKSCSLVIKEDDLTGDECDDGIEEGEVKSREGQLSMIRPDLILNYESAMTVGAASLVYPIHNSDVYTSRIKLQWQKGEGADPDGYFVYLVKSNEDFSALYIADVEEPEYIVNNLHHNVIYKWKVVPYLNNTPLQTGISEWQFSVKGYANTYYDSGTETGGYTQSFNAGSLPSFWSQQKGYPDGDRYDESLWAFGNYLNDNTKTKAARMRMNIGDLRAWLVSPAFEVPVATEDDKYEFVFDMGLTKAGSSAQILDANAQNDYKLTVYMSNNPEMPEGAINPIREWDNDSSAHVFNNIPYAGTTATIPLNVSGYKYFAFYAETNRRDGDVDLFIDNVRVRKMSNEPEIEIGATAVDFRYINCGEANTRDISIRNIGGGTLEVKATDVVLEGSNPNNFMIQGVFPIYVQAGGMYNLPISVSGSGNDAIESVSATLTISGIPVILSAKILPKGQVVVGNGELNHGLPHNTNYKYSYSQSIYLNSEANLKYHKITGIKYYLNNGSVPSEPESVSFRMQLVDMDSFTSNEWYTDTDTISISSIELANDGWYTIDFSDNGNAGHFKIMNDKNLLVGIEIGDHRNENFTGNFYTSSRTTNRSLIYSNNSFRTDDYNSPTYGQNFSVLKAIPNTIFKLEKIVDILPGEHDLPFTFDDATFTMSMSGDGAANIAAYTGDDFPTSTNPSITDENSAKLLLTVFGENEKIITINSNEYGFASYYNGADWVVATNGAKNSGGLVFTFPGTSAAAGQAYPILLSDSNPTLPVELSHFSVTLNKENDAVIRWTTQSETGVNGFYIYRNSRDKFDNAELISSLIPATNSSNETQYSFTDDTLYETGTYYYWLLVLDINGSENLTGPLTLQYDIEDGPEGVVPVVTTIKSIYPNPFNPSTTIAYSLKDKEDVSIHIYNTRGQLVFSVDRGTQDVGHYEYIWNGTSTNGNKLSSGVYFIRLKAGKTIINKKAMLMK